MRSQRYATDYFLHDDKNYILKYSKSSPDYPFVRDGTQRTLTIPISTNSLFYLRAMDDYENFMTRNPYYLKEFKHFTGVAHITTGDTDSTFFPFSPSESPDIDESNDKKMNHSSFSSRKTRKSGKKII